MLLLVAKDRMSAQFHIVLFYSYSRSIDDY